MNARRTGIALLLGLALTLPLAHAASVTVTGVEFLPDKTIKVPMVAQKNAPAAVIEADVRFKLGQSQVKLKYKDLKPAILFGGDVTSYVLWAITSDGRAVNLGQVQNGSKTSGTETFYAGLKGFAMLITAEPYFMVARPSEMVMFVGDAPQMGKSRWAPYEFNAFAKAPKHAVEKIDALKWDAKTDLLLLQARKAYELAGRYQAKSYARDQYELATLELRAAEEYAEKGSSDKKTDNSARNALQLSNTSINIAIRKRAAEELAEIIAAHRAKLKAVAERSETAEMMAAVLANQQAQMRTTLDEVESENIELKTLLGGALSQIASTRIEAARVVLTLPGILFDTDKATLKPDAELALARLSGILMVFHRATVSVEGYTDTTGSDKYNLKLSGDRAETVRTFFAEQGVAEGRLGAIGHGSANPIADNETADGRASNRRVELIIHTGQI